MAIKTTFFTDFLKEYDTRTKTERYSQGRVYLLWSVVAYYITLGFVTAKSFMPNSPISVETLKVIIEALQYALLLFGGYVFGGKFLDAAKMVLGKTTPTNIAPTDPTQPTIP